ncbi:hypothetical protein PoB_006731300 [Plakobranchus ocellatus]|uniref:Uncharacterized protein n=1 Tax=Plakobranchus ocellatus TaxID=259542 RepID=A0AAV4D9S1_9GAST|nr:hypothetical protein PoB_006731300 [Plakobranchus ocellatus]
MPHIYHVFRFHSWSTFVVYPARLERQTGFLTQDTLAAAGSRVGLKSTITFADECEVGTLSKRNGILSFRCISRSPESLRLNDNAYCHANMTSVQKLLLGLLPLSSVRLHLTFKIGLI